MDEIRCWRCDRKLGESSLEASRPTVVCPALHPAADKERVVINCPRCRAPNVVLIVDKAMSTA
jgi:Zn finger protein HypA/HybF involved in hydrogenase expression